jgi:hypothetical protein
MMLLLDTLPIHPERSFNHESSAAFLHVPSSTEKTSQASSSRLLDTTRNTLGSLLWRAPARSPALVICCLCSAALAFVHFPLISLHFYSRSILSSIFIYLRTMSDGCDIQPSLLEYARFHALADNHLNQDIIRCLPSDIFPCRQDARLPELELPIGNLPSETKFRLDSKAASLLASCIKPPAALPWSDTLSDHRRVKKLKFEQPGLKTDHDDDMRKIRSRKSPRAAVTLVPYELDEAEDQACSPQLTGLATEWDNKIAGEKLQTTREVLKVLQNTLRPVYTTEMHEAILAEGLTFSQVWPSNSWT